MIIRALKLLLVVLISINFIRCKSTFYTQADKIINAKNLTGVYENQSILSPFGNKDLWHCIKRNSKIKNNDHLVYLELKKNKIYAKLIKNNAIVEKAKIKGTLTDTCFIARKKFFIVPILPILFFYKNQKIRISARDSSLIIDEYAENGGALIIMAAGSNRTTSYEYKKISNKDSIALLPNVKK